MAYDKFFYTTRHVLDGDSECTDQNQGNPGDTGGPDEKGSSTKVIDHDRPDQGDTNRYNGEEQGEHKWIGEVGHLVSKRMLAPEHYEDIRCLYYT
jgi:hypothetical protein